MGEDLDWLEKEIRTAAKERAESKVKISLLMGTIKKQVMDAKNLSELLENKSKEVDHLQTEMEAFRNYSQSSLYTAFNMVGKMTKTINILFLHLSHTSLQTSVQSSLHTLQKNVFSTIEALQDR